MTVRELIIKLMDFDPNLIACIDDNNGSILFVDGLIKADWIEASTNPHVAGIQTAAILYGREYGNNILILTDR